MQFGKVALFASKAKISTLFIAPFLAHCVLKDRIILYYVLTFHLETFAGPHHLRSWVAFDFALEKSIATLCKSGIAKNLLKNGWGGAFRRINRHVFFSSSYLFVSKVILAERFEISYTYNKEKINNIFFKRVSFSNAASSRVFFVS